MSEQRGGGRAEKEVWTGVSDGYNYTLQQRGVLVPPLLHDLRVGVTPTSPTLSQSSLFTECKSWPILGSRGHY